MAGHQTSSPVFGVSKAVLDIRILPPLCPDQGCIDTALNKSNFLTFSRFPLHCMWPVLPTLRQLSSSCALSKLELRNFPKRFFLCWFVAHQGTGRKAVLWKLQHTGPICYYCNSEPKLLNFLPNCSLPPQFALSLYTEFCTLLAITSITQQGQEILLYFKNTYWILHKYSTIGK